MAGEPPMTPVLTTARLCLRPLEHADAPVLARLADNWNVAAMLSRMPFPYTLAHAEEFIARQVSGPADGTCVFAIGGGAGLMGVIGLHPDEAGTLELGYWLGEPFWGAGYATEAAGRVLAFADGELEAETVTAGHFFDNPASGRVLRKTGFRYTHDLVRACAARGTTVLCHEMMRPRGGTSA